jgi:hypothetical protein
MDTPRAIHHLYAALAVTWVIHIGYIAFLARKAAALREQARELMESRRSLSR